MTKIFCGEPWKQIFIGPDSKPKTCCSGRVPLGDLQHDNIQQILSGTILREIKQSILNNEWHENCTLCKELEEKGIESQRIRTEKDFLNGENYFEDINYHIPEMIDIRWDNTCNLACNYCMPYFSSVWASLKHEYQKSPRNNDGVIQYLKENKDSIKHAILLGGEPFLQKKNSELLDIITDDTTVHFITNLSFGPLENNSLFQKLSEKKNHVSFGVSFENIEEKFEYVRHGAKWDVFLSNLKILKDKFTVTAMPLYCCYSAFNLMEYYDFIAEQNIRLRWQKIEGPRELNVSLLPWELRKKAIREIEKVLLKYENVQNMDIETLIQLKDSLLVEEKNYISIEQVQIFHQELEKKYHEKAYTFLNLWPVFNYV